MATLDPTTDIGKLRLRVADFSDLPYFPDEVYQATLDDKGGNIPSAAATMAGYILGVLAHQTHRKMGLQLEVWGAEAFENYRKFLILTTSNPAFMAYNPLPYSTSTTDDPNPLIAFQKDWNRNYYCGTDSQQLAFTAELSPNDGSRLGIYNFAPPLTNPYGY